jgi:hypothetical protein
MRFTELTTSGTYVLKQSAGFLQGITVNLPAGTTPTLTLWDSNGTTSTMPAIAGGSAAFALPAAGAFLQYNVHFSNGLTVVLAGTGTQSYTVSYY